jgi:GAF domain-containing protein
MGATSDEARGDPGANDLRPPTEAVRRQLARIVGSPAFRDASQLTSFLTFVVEATLGGGGDRLKAYTIATQALGRSASFDPLTDPIVRVEAGRLRQALGRYYSGEGRYDPIVVALPRGNYVPDFRLRGSREAAHAAAAADRDSVLLNEALLRLVDLCQLIPDLVQPARVSAERGRSNFESSASDAAPIDAVRLLGPWSGNQDGAAAADGDPPPAAEAGARAETAIRLIAMLDKLSAQLLASRDFKSAVETVLDATIKLHGADFGNVQLLDEQTHELVIYAQRGFGPRFLETFARVSAQDTCACARALRLRKPIVVADVRTDPGFANVLDVVAEAGYRAVQSTPLITGSGKLVGVASTHFARPHRPSTLDMLITRFYGRLAADLLERLAHGETGVAADSDQRSAATADARAENGFRLIATLDELSARLLAARDFNSAVETILDAAIKLHGADFGTVQLLDEPTGELVIYAQRGFGPQVLQSGPRISLRENWACARSLRLRKPIIVADVRTDPHFAEMRDVAAAAGYRAVQSTPLIGGSGKPVGVVSTYFARPHRPSKLDMLMMRFYGRLAADLLERLPRGGSGSAAAEPQVASPGGLTPSPASDPPSTEAASRLLDALQVQLRGATDLPSVAEAILAGIVGLHKSDFGSVQLLDEQSGELVIVAQHGFHPDLVRPFLRIAARPDHYLSGRAVWSRAPVIVNDAFAAVEFPVLRASAAATGYRAVQATPMITNEGRLVGVLATHFTRVNATERLDMAMTQLYARLAANALVQLLPPPRRGISLEWSIRAA